MFLFAIMKKFGFSLDLLNFDISPVIRARYIDDSYFLFRSRYYFEKYQITGTVNAKIPNPFLKPKVKTLMLFIEIKVTGDYGLSVVCSIWDSYTRVPCSKSLGGSLVDSTYHLSMFDKMITRTPGDLMI